MPTSRRRSYVHRAMRVQTPHLDCPALECAELVIEVGTAFVGVPAWASFKHDLEGVVAIVARAEVMVAVGHPSAAAFVAEANAALHAPIRFLRSRLARLGSDESPIPGSPVTSSLDEHFVALTEEALHRQEAFLVNVVARAVRAHDSSAESVPMVMTTREAAELARVSPKTIRAWIKSGRLEALGSTPYKFSREAVVSARDHAPVEPKVLDLEAKAEELLRRGDSS